MIQAIFFDFNGVIIDDEPLQLAAYKDLLREHGVDLTESDYYGALGMDDRTFVRYAFERSNKTVSDADLKLMMDAKTVRHREMIAEELPLFPGVVTFLKSAARDYSLGLVSMAVRAEIEYVLERAGLLSRFSVIISAEDVSACKPAPECYQTAFRKLNEKRQSERRLPLLAAECLVIEDSPPGIVSGREAGMRTMGITNTVTEQQLRAAGADVVTASLADWNVDAVRHVFKG
jgi:HAD superfamily hydrolase (TIGR01509 family)